MADKLTVKYLPIADLIPYARNSRTHSDEQVAQIASSMREFGWTNPVLVDEEGGIIAGHGRVMGANLVWKNGGEIRNCPNNKAPTIMLSGLTAEQRKAYVIADNQLAMNAGWNTEMLALELQELANAEYDLSLVGFDDKELQALLDSVADDIEGETDPDDVPEVPETPVSVQGDVWILGDHRLKCGDSTSWDDIKTLMLEDERADMVFTDPPWNVNYGATATPKYKQGRQILNDHMEPEDWKKFVDDVCSSLHAATKPGALMYCVMSAQEWPVIDKGLREAFFHWSSTIIWVKDSLVISRKDYHTQYEPIWYGWNSQGPRLMEVPDRKQSDIWNVQRPKKSELHPTTKPIDLIERALNNSSWRGAVVLDLFGGSGSTLIASHKTGRVARLMELDPKYVDVIVKRWQEFAGEEAVNEETGMTYAELASDRGVEIDPGGKDG